MTQLIQTGDGSPTLYVPALDEHYHSTHGAIQEAEHVYVGAGLTEGLKRGMPVLRVLEMGFGTGLNALLTWEFGEGGEARSEERGARSEEPGVRSEEPGARSEKGGVRGREQEEWSREGEVRGEGMGGSGAGRVIRYEAIEKFPLSPALAERFLAALPADEARRAGYRALHGAAWEEEVALGEGFTLLKRQGGFEELDFGPGGYDVIYYDAFAPRKQPELWTDEVLGRAGNLLAPGGVIVTYCATGALKRAWRAVGLAVESLPGAPGKREMVRARRG